MRVGFAIYTNINETEETLLFDGPGKAIADSRVYINTEVFVVLEDITIKSLKVWACTFGAVVSRYYLNEQNKWTKIVCCTRLQVYPLISCSHKPCIHNT